MRVTTPVPRIEWDRIHAEDPGAVAEHSPRWIDAIESVTSWRDASRLYQLDDGRRFVLPLVRRTGPAGVGGWYASPPAAWGFGGIVGAGLDRQVVRSIVEDLAAMGALRISIRPDPMTADAWAGIEGRGITRVPRFAHVIDLAGGIDAVESRYNKNTRRGARKAERSGVEVELDQTGGLLPVHYELYLTAVETWSQRQREPLALARWRAKRRDPLEKLQAMAEHLGKDFCQFVAYLDGRPIASSILLTGPAAHDTRAAMDKDVAGPVRANDLLQTRSIRHAVEAGCTSYHLGESGTSATLASFKERWGAVGHEYAEVRIERLPITRADTAARGAVKRLIGFKDQ